MLNIPKYFGIFQFMCQVDTYHSCGNTSRTQPIFYFACGVLPAFAAACAWHLQGPGVQLHYVEVVIIITEEVHASNSIPLAHIVLKIMQLQVRKPRCMWGGQGLARLRSRLWLLRLLGQRETGLWLTWVLGLHNWLWRQLCPPTSGVCG
jgi:hypothetical protein